MRSVHSLYIKLQQYRTVRYADPGSASSVHRSYSYAYQCTDAQPRLDSPPQRFCYRLLGSKEEHSHQSAVSAALPGKTSFLQAPDASSLGYAIRQAYLSFANGACHQLVYSPDSKPASLQTPSYPLRQSTAHTPPIFQASQDWREVCVVVQRGNRVLLSRVQRS